MNDDLKLRSISQSVILTSSVLKIDSAFITVELIDTKLQTGYEVVVKLTLYLTHPVILLAADKHSALCRAGYNPMP